MSSLNQDEDRASGNEASQDFGESTNDSVARRFRTSIVVATCAVLVSGFGVLTWLLRSMSTRVFAGNSDAATVVLEGQTLNQGHLALQGWGLSRDSFWTIDALFYALIIRVSGVSQSAMHVGPALIFAATVLLGLWFVREEDRSWRGWIAFFVLVLCIGIPSPVLSFYVLQGPWHVGTALWCLIAFAGLAKGGFRWGFILAVVVLAAGLLGDFETLAFGIVPVVLAGGLEMVRARSWKSGLPSVGAGLLAAGFAWALRALVRGVGGFSISTSVTHAPSSRYLTNIGHAFLNLPGLFGITKLSFGPNTVVGRGAPQNGPLISHLVHLPFLLVVIVAGLVTVGLFIRSLWFGVSRIALSEEKLRIDLFLLIGAAGSIASYVVLTPNNNGSYVRYLSAAAIFLAILGARYLARTLQKVSHRGVLQATAALIAVVCVGVGFNVADDLSSPPARLKATALVTFLESRHLTVGVGDYWSASIVSVISGDRVKVRPVITNTKSQIVRYQRQSSASWYRGVPFQFLVYNVKHPWRDINAKTATWTFGRPTRGFVVGDFRVIVWPHTLAVSTQGFTNA